MRFYSLEDGVNKTISTIINKNCNNKINFSCCN